MHIKLEINAESVEEFDAAVARFAPRATLVVNTVGEVTLPARGSTAAEAESPLGDTLSQTATRKPRAGRSQTAADTAAETGSPTKTEAAKTETAAPSGTPASSEPDGHPMLVAKTLADVKALGNKKVSELGAGPIQQALIENFGVNSFRGLDPADYDRAHAVMEALK